MTTVPWLTLLGLVPVVGAVIILLLPKSRPVAAKAVALVFSVAALLLTVVIALQFDGNSTERFQFVERYPWIPMFRIDFAVGLDGIALVLIALAAVLVPVAIISGWREPDEASGGSAKAYYAWILVLETLMFGVFAATDVFLFYVFFEAMLIPVYFLIGRFGGVQRSYAAVKFLIYSLVGGLLLLVAMIGLYVVSLQSVPGGTFDVATLGDIDMNLNTQLLLFLGFFIAFAIKAPLWPFHTWLPDAAGQATPGTSILLIGVLDKVGTFGMLRYCLPIFPAAASFYAPVVIALAVIGIFYGGYVALGQTDMKRIFAYSSLSHFGFIVLGIFVFTQIGTSGSVVYMVAHGLSVAALFGVAGYLMSRNRGSAQLGDYGGVIKPAPVLAGFFLFACLSSLALPGLVSFVGEFMVLLGTFQRILWVGALATLGIVLTAAYVLRVYQRTMTGPVAPSIAAIKDLSGREITAMAPVVILTLLLGFWPAPVLNAVNPAVDRTLAAVDAPPVGNPVSQGSDQ